MKLTVVSGQEDVFERDGEFAYKDGVIYDILCSQKSYLAGACLGRMRIVVENGKVLKQIYPLMSDGEYEILDANKIDRMRNIVTAYDNHYSKLINTNI
jgi:hypothetical protein